MKNRSKAVVLATFIMVPIILPPCAEAQTMKGSVHIVTVTTGYGSDTVGMETVEPVINPANCALTSQYISDAGDPGNRTYYAAALAALTNKLVVDVVVSNTQCSVNGWPKILAVNPHWP